MRRGAFRATIVLRISCASAFRKLLLGAAACCSSPKPALGQWRSLARRNRILLSEAAIAPIQWFVILTLDGLMLATFAMMHIDRPPTAIFSMLVMSTAVAVSLVLLMVYDRPLGSGGITLQPAALREIEIGDTPGSITDLCRSAR